MIIIAQHNASYCHGNTYFEGYFLPNWVLKIIDDVIETSFLNQSQQNFLISFVIPKSISVQDLMKIGQEAKKLQK